MSLLDSGFGLTFRFQTQGMSELRSARNETMGVVNSVRNLRDNAKMLNNEKSFQHWSQRVRQESKKLRAETMQLNQSMSAGMRLAGGASIAVGGFLTAGGMAGLDFIGDSVNQSMEFETVMNSLRLRAGKTKEEVEGLGTEFKRMSKDLQGSAIDMAQAGEIFAKSGYQIPEIAGATREAMVLSTSEGIQVATAAKTLAGMNSIFRDSLSSLENPLAHVNSSIIAMSDATLGSGDALSKMTERSGFAAQQLGLTVDQVLAMSGAVSDMKVPTQLAGTAMMQIFQGIAENSENTAKLVGMTTTRFKHALKTDTMGVLQQVLSKIAALQKAGRADIIKDVIKGFTGKAESRLVLTVNALAASMKNTAQNSELAGQGVSRLQELLMLSRKEFEAGTLAQRRMEERLKALSARIERLKSTWTNIKITFGEAYTTIIGYAVDLAQFVLDTFQALPIWLQKGIGLMIGLGSVAAVALGGTLVLAGLLAFSLSSINTQLAMMGVNTSVFGLMQKGIGFLIARLKVTNILLVTTRFLVKGIGIAFRSLLGPIGWVATAVYLIADNFDAVSAAATKMFSIVGGLFSAFSDGSLTVEQYNQLGEEGLLGFAGSLAKLGKYTDSFFEGIGTGFSSFYENIKIASDTFKEFFMTIFGDQFGSGNVVGGTAEGFKKINAEVKNFGVLFGKYIGGALSLVATLGTAMVGLGIIISDTVITQVRSLYKFVGILGSLISYVTSGFDEDKKGVLKDEMEAYLNMRSDYYDRVLGIAGGVSKMAVSSLAGKNAGEATEDLFLSLRGYGKTTPEQTQTKMPPTQKVDVTVKTQTLLDGEKIQTNQTKHKQQYQSRGGYSGAAISTGGL